MQLLSEERSIISYFPSRTKAKKAMEALKQTGYETITIRNVVAQEKEVTAINPMDAGILLASGPSASGLVGEMHLEIKLPF